MKSKQDAKPGEPCDHRGCLSHVSHPCDGCGRIGGQGHYFAQHRLSIPWDEIDKEDAAERAKRAGYRAADYTGNNCKNCGRNRVMNCVNGKHVCEKCGWDADANAYDPDFPRT